MKHILKKIMTGLVLLILAGCSKQNFGMLDKENQFGQAVTYNNKVDVLWVVDNSNSMIAHQSGTAAQVSMFLNALNSTGMDYHIGVTTMDCSGSGLNGRLMSFPEGSPTVLTNSTPNLLSILQQRIQIGGGGSTIERGLEATKLALTEPLVSGFNKGFRRLSSDHSSGAVLAVIYLTDEDDSSGSAVPDPVAFFNSNSVTTSWGSSQWVVNFIGTTPDDPTCQTVPWTRIDGLTYIGLANHSGGAVGSICSGNFGAAITNIQGHVLSMITSYHFDKKPQVATIKAYIDGNLIPNDPSNGWTYDGNLTLYFHGSAIPQVGSIVKVAYLPEGF